MSLTALWDKAQFSLREKIGESSYDTWFSSIQAREKDPQCLVLETPDEFYKNWIIDHYLDLIEETVRPLSTETVSFEVIVNKDSAAASSPQIKTVPTQPPVPAANELNLNPRFSFNNFVVGPSNRFAYAACMAVAESPAKAYNPLFLYGKVGLGKTHLLQAITLQIKVHHPQMHCFYTSSEKFTNELIDAIRHRSTSQFRQKYRNIDVLLIDDIHFIAGKESTQEEFFHTFNTLHNNHKQIIISSDRPPKDIANLEERLSSRFAWGLITDIQPPDYETRVAILRKKCEREPVEMPDDVISFIAEQIKANIRELEGALIRVVAYSLLEEKPISLEMAKAVLRDMVKQQVSTISIETIQQCVCNYFRISSADLKANRRNKNVILPRQVAMYLSRQMTELSLPEIGKAFGGKDHTTVLHSFKKIDQEVLENQSLKDTIEKIKIEIKK